MDELVKQVGSFLVGQGWAGIICLILLFAVYRLFGLLMATQEKRVEERGAAATALSESSKALNQMAEAISQLRLTGRGQR